MSVEARLRAEVAAHRLEFDASQVDAAVRLDRLGEALKSPGSVRERLRKHLVWLTSASTAAAPLRGLYARNRVYEGVTGMESFAPWLDRLEKQMTERALDELMKQIPPAWYEDDLDAVLRRSEQLLRRRPRVPELILAAIQSNRQPFPNWI